MIDDSQREVVVHALLRQLAADAAAGTERTVADYAARFPGHEDLVASELRALDGEGANAATAATLQVGPYTIRRELGRGGQATVYLAHDPRLGRDVALKVLPRGRAGLAQELRLQREASTAARLDDSGICPVYEVGRDGEHVYLAMKFVTGRTLAAELEQRRQRLAAGERLDVAAGPVAGTLQFFERLATSLHRAHEAGVVHRDLKPANVMVDEAGAPVLLDFGLAIAPDAEAAPLTRSGDLFGTPQYLSPERLSDRDHRGDVRDDLWAFAVTLYEALTLRRPFQEPTLEHLYRAILAAAPARLRALRPSLPRDLERVLAIAFDPQPQRRYRTAADFAADLRAVAVGEPIRARPPGPWRRVVRWHRRHAVAATAGWLVLAGTGTAFAVQQSSLVQVRAAQSEALGVNEFLVEKLLLAVTPEQAQGREITAAQVFDQALQNVEASFPEPSRTGGTLHHVLGLANKGLGRLRQARTNMERAVAVRTAVLGPDARDTFASRRELVELLRATDDLGAAEAQMAELLPRLQAVLGAADPDTLAARQEQVRLVMARGQHAEAERLARAMVADHTAALGPDARATLAAVHLLARVLERAEKRAEAEPLMRDVLERRRRLLGENSPAYGSSVNDLASLLHDMATYDGVERAFDQAEKLYEEGVAFGRRIHGERSQSYATSLNNLASFLQDRGRRQQDVAVQQRAVAMFRESLALRQAIDGAESSRVATALSNLGGALIDVQDYPAAVATLTQALALRERLHGPEHRETVRTCFNLMMANGKARYLPAAVTARDDLAARLSRSRGVEVKTRLHYRQGMWLVQQLLGSTEAVLADGTVLYDECVQAWPPDGGGTGRAIADMLQTVCLDLGHTEAAATWAARSKPAK